MGKKITTVGKDTCSDTVGQACTVLLVIIGHPLLHLRHHPVNDLPRTFIDPIPNIQIIAMCSFGNDPHRGLLGGLQRASRSRLGRDGGWGPGVILPIHPHEARRVDMIPAACLQVDLVDCAALVETIGRIADGREHALAIRQEAFASESLGYEAVVGARTPGLPPLKPF